jgi:hypothetical protein
MVKKRISRKRRRNQGRGSRVERDGHKRRVAEIGANTPHGLCSERITPFGGLLALVKFLDLIAYRDVFEGIYVSPDRKPKLGCYRMLLGLLILLFVGFQRIAHTEYIREDAVVCGILKVGRLPAVSTFWRYVRSLSIIQSQALLRVMAELRARVWRLIGYQPRRVSINIDTTVATVYGKTEGAEKGYNPKHRGKKGLRPVLCFIHETREYLCGKQRRGQTISREEVARQIRGFRSYLPACVKKVLVRADEEFIGWESVKTCLECGYSFIFASSGCKLPLPADRWYSYKGCEYNECWYQPKEWKRPCRFVVMRKLKGDEAQLYLLEEDRYTYRAFATNLDGKPHKVIANYDQRGDVENLIGEAQREGILAIPSKRFQSNHAFFQMVMLAYNLWRWLKHLAGHQRKEETKRATGETPQRIEVVDQTVRLARLKMLYIAAKISSHANREHVYYSIHDSRSAQVITFLDYLDRRRAESIPLTIFPRGSPFCTAS